MRLIISLFIALMIFTFSFLGEDIHASTASHGSESSISHAADEGSSDLLTSEIHVHTASAMGLNLETHDCHFGHCAFTLFLPTLVGAPVAQVASAFFPPTSLLLSGIRSETIRPPALI